MSRLNSHELILIRRAVGQDYDAITELYDLYSPRLKRFLGRIIQDRETIEELVNDTMLIVWQKAGEFRGDSAVSTWILGIAYRKGIDAVRKVQSNKNLLKQIEVAQWSKSEIAELIANRDLDKLMKGLSLEQRAVAELSFDFGYSYPEIAEILKIPAGTVKTRMFYARKTMQALLEAATGRKS